MIVSSEQVKRFLLELIDSSSFPGRIADFVVSVKQEVQNATIENKDKAKDIK